ncbi:Protein of unknown function, partial [Cotesia congregata]
MYERSCNVIIRVGVMILQLDTFELLPLFFPRCLCIQSFCNLNKMAAVVQASY